MDSRAPGILPRAGFGCAGEIVRRRVAGSMAASGTAPRTSTSPAARAASLTGGWDRIALWVISKPDEAHEVTRTKRPADFTVTCASPTGDQPHHEQTEPPDQTPRSLSRIVAPQASTRSLPASPWRSRSKHTQPSPDPPRLAPRLLAGGAWTRHCWCPWPRRLSGPSSGSPRCTRGATETSVR